MNEVDTALPDMTPLTDAAIWEGMESHEGTPWAWVGEDAEQAVMRGWVEPDLLIAALSAYTDLDAEDVTHEWWLFTEHVPDCREDLDDGDHCGCDEWKWWATFAGNRDATTVPDGAQPVTAWSA